jgi:hypothetical protein
MAEAARIWSPRAIQPIVGDDYDGEREFCEEICCEVERRGT